MEDNIECLIKTTKDKPPPRQWDVPVGKEIENSDRIETRN